MFTHTRHPYGTGGAVAPDPNDDSSTQGSSPAKGKENKQGTNVMAPQRGRDGLLSIETLIAAKHTFASNIIRGDSKPKDDVKIEHWIWDGSGSTKLQINAEAFVRALKARSQNFRFRGLQPAAGEIDGRAAKDEILGGNVAAPCSTADAAREYHYTFKKFDDNGPLQCEWFHMFGACENAMQAVCQYLAVNKEHQDLVITKNDERPKIDFTPGMERKDDYVFILAHEIKERSNKTDKKNTDSKQPSSPSKRAAVENDENEARETGLEEVQVCLFYFPERNLLISVGDLEDSGYINACRKSLTNPISSVMADTVLTSWPSDMARPPRISRPSGAGSLLTIILDGLMDDVFPLLDNFGDALEGLRCLLSQHPKHEHARVSYKIKAQITQLRRQIWDFRGLLLEMSQDNSGALGPIIEMRLQTLFNNLDQLEKEIGSYIDACASIDTFYQSHQDSEMNQILFSLTAVTVSLLPVQIITGLYGMNFDGEVSPLNMPELRWEYGYLYVVFFIVSWITLVCITLFVYSRRQKATLNVKLLVHMAKDPKSSAKNSPRGMLSPRSSRRSS